MINPIMSSGNSRYKSTDIIEKEHYFLMWLTGKNVTNDIDSMFRSLSKNEQGQAIHVFPEQLNNQIIKM